MKPWLAKYLGWKTVDGSRLDKLSKNKFLILEESSGKTRKQLMEYVNG